MEALSLRDASGELAIRSGSFRNAKQTHRSLNLRIGFYAPSPFLASTYSLIIPPIPDSFIPGQFDRDINGPKGRGQAFFRVRQGDFRQSGQNLG